MENLTKKQEKLIKFLENPRNWRPPTHSQICNHMGWKSKNAADKALKRIIKKGYQIKPR